MNAKQLIEFLSTYNENTEVKIFIMEKNQYSMHNFLCADMDIVDTDTTKKDIGIAFLIDLTKSKPLYINQN